MKERRRLGSTGVDVVPVGLGAMPLSLAGRPPEAEAISVIRAFVEAGGDFIDTANVYCLDTADLGHNERLVRKALDVLGRPAHVRVATKGGLNKEGGGWDCDGSPAWLRRSCERSLSDLGVECIFLYQLHAPDPGIPLAESVGELKRLRDEGKIRHIGLSNVDVSEIQIATAITPVVSVQNRFNIFQRKSQVNGVLSHCAREGLAFIAHSPVGGHLGHRQLGKSAPLAKIGRAHDASPYQVALAWILGQGPQVFPIPGASRPASILSSLAALDLKLDPAEQAELDAL